MQMSSVSYDWASFWLFFSLTSELQRRSRGSCLWRTSVSLASILCLLDIVEVFVRSGSAPNTPNTPNTSEISAQQTVPTQNADAGGQAVVQLPRSNKAFEVESGNRRKFMMTFTGRSRWPSMLNVPTVKEAEGRAGTVRFNQRSSNTLYCRVNERVNNEMRRGSCSSSLINFVLNLSKLFLINCRMSSS